MNARWMLVALSLGLLACGDEPAAERRAACTVALDAMESIRRDADPARDELERYRREVATAGEAEEGDARRAALASFLERNGRVPAQLDHECNAQRDVAERVLRSAAGVIGFEPSELPPCPVATLELEEDRASSTAYAERLGRELDAVDEGLAEAERDLRARCEE